MKVVTDCHRDAAGGLARPRNARPLPAAVVACRSPTVSTIGQSISVSCRGPGQRRACGVPARPPPRAAAGQAGPGPEGYSLPVFSTLVISVLALATVEAKFAPCSSAFVMVGRIWSVVSTIVQFLALNGEMSVTVAALANPDMSWLPEYAPLVSLEVYGGKNPCRLANEVELASLSMVWIRSQSAVLNLLVAKMPRSEPPAKAGAGFGAFSLGIGKEAKPALSTAFFGNSDCAHGPSMYMPSLPSAKSSLDPPEVAPGLPSSVWPMYLAGDTLSTVVRPT